MKRACKIITQKVNSKVGALFEKELNIIIRNSKSVNC
jgi:hypothetical protein